MTQNWKTYKLGDLCTNVYSGGTPSTKNPEYYDGEIPWLNTKEVDFKSIYSTEKFITEEGLKKSSAKWVPKNAVVIAMYGNTAGKSAINKIPLTTNQACCNLIVDDKIADYRFVYYYVLNDYELIKDLSVGGAQQNLNAGTIKNYEVILPPLPEQTAIASILSALDDKIELNLQQNKTLEEMAMALYKHWFVDFGPFQDGEFVESELGMIPKGWEVKRLVEFANLTMGQSPKSEFYNDSKEGLPFHQGVKDYGERFPNDVTYSTEGNREAEEGDILFSVRAPVGRLNLAKNKIILGRGLASIRMEENNEFMFYALKSMFTTEDIIGSGTVFNSVNKTELEKLEFVIPTNEILSDFKQLVKPLDSEYANNSIENQTLTNLRDTLLPKLISGEVRVKDIEHQIKDVL